MTEELPVVTLGHPALRQRARTIDAAHLHQADVLACMTAVESTFFRLFERGEAVGLAAPQLGFDLAVFVMQDMGLTPASPASARDVGRRAFGPLLACNPEITARSEETVTAWEFCLSAAGVVGLVTRAVHVELAYMDASGKDCRLGASDWCARIIQHEVDHLHGCLCVDHYRPGTVMDMETFRATWRERPTHEARMAFGIER